MLVFCPNCGNRLIVHEDVEPSLSCPTCPYRKKIKGRVESAKYFKLKEVDDVLNDANTWRNVDQADSKCPKCEHDKAYFMQLQIRSADEPMTTFYRCVSCSHNWKEN